MKFTKILLALSACSLFSTAFAYAQQSDGKHSEFMAHLQSSVFKLSKDLIDSIHEEGIVAYTS